MSFEGQKRINSKIQVPSTKFQIPKRKVYIFGIWNLEFLHRQSDVKNSTFILF